VRAVARHKRCIRINRSGQNSRNLRIVKRPEGFQTSILGMAQGTRDAHRLAGVREVIVDSRRLIRSGGSAGWPWGIAPPGLPQIRACPSRAPGSSCHLVATGRHTEWIAIGAGSGLRFKKRAKRSHVIRLPRPRRDSQCCQSHVSPLRNRPSDAELPVIP
jgi:hypothetical protein